MQPSLFPGRFKRCRCHTHPHIEVFSLVSAGTIFRFRALLAHRQFSFFLNAMRGPRQIFLLPNEKPNPRRQLWLSFKPPSPFSPPPPARTAFPFLRGRRPDLPTSFGFASALSPSTFSFPSPSEGNRRFVGCFGNGWIFYGHPFNWSQHLFFLIVELPDATFYL